VTPGLYDTIRLIVRDELGRIRTAEVGIVEEQHPHSTESDKDNYACTVRLRNSGLILKQVPVATHRIGAVAIPGIGETVLVQFIGGDMNSPVITGRLYNEEERPPANEDGKAVLHLPSGAADSGAVHVELLSKDKREFTMRLGDGLVLSLRDDDPVVEVDVGGQATLSIARNGDVEVKSNGKLKFEGSEILIEAQGPLKLKGATIDLN
jgi:phage baseplate assembly protein gpV